MFWNNVAHAMGSLPGGEGGGLGSIMSVFPFILVFVIIYFLTIRPQMKKDQEHKCMLKSLKPGDRVMTAGGIYGTLVDVKEETVLIDVGNNIQITVNRQSVGSLMATGKTSKEERRSRRERKHGSAEGDKKPAESADSTTESTEKSDETFENSEDKNAKF